MKIPGAATAAALILIAAGAAAAFTIDGDLSDWGVHPGPFGSSDWTPDAGIDWVSEDQITNYLYPAYGGQTFDAEALYSSATQDTLYVAVVTGFPATGVTWGSKHYLPGDLAVRFLDKPGGYQFGVRTVSGGGFTAGGVYRTHFGNWAKGGFGAISDPTFMKKHPAKTGQGALVYAPQSDYVANGEHWIVEAAIPTAAFGAYYAGDYRLHWTMSCGNDAIDLWGSAPPPPPPPVIPEPSTFLLLGMGLLGIGGFARKRRAPAGPDRSGI